MAEASSFDSNEQDTIDITPTGRRRNKYVLTDEGQMESVDLDLPIHELVHAPIQSVRLQSP